MRPRMMENDSVQAAPFFQQLSWMLWKNYRLKCRNWKSTVKELAFPIYTFALIALLKVAMNIDVGQDAVQEWDASPIQSLEKTRSGYVCTLNSDRGIVGTGTGKHIRDLEADVVYSERFGMLGKPQQGGQVASGGSCCLLISPANDDMVAKV